MTKEEFHKRKNEVKKALKSFGNERIAAFKVRNKWQRATGDTDQISWSFGPDELHKLQRFLRKTHPGAVKSGRVWIGTMGQFG